MGVVYEALDEERGETVALKTVPTPDAEAIYRTKQEFRALADLEHPNLVQLYDLVVEDGACFFTMELVRGEGLLPHCSRFRAIDPAAATLDGKLGPRFDEGRLRDAFGQLARGLAALHAAGRIHRDVKPPNVLVTEAGRVVLLDFGLARSMDAPANDSLGGGVVGTATYMSPEQARGDAELTAATDTYAFGVMLYEALTGATPHHGTLFELLAAKQGSDPPPPSSTTPRIPADLDALCAGLLRVEPGARPRDEEILACFGVENVPVSSHSSTRTSFEASALSARQAELAALQRASDLAAAGGRVHARVHGRSGMGKTTLVRHFLRTLQHGGALVLASRCYPQESIPYKALDGAIDGLSRHLRALPASEVDALLPDDVETVAAVFPALRRVEAIASRAAHSAPAVFHPSDARVRAFRGLRTILGKVAAGRRVVLSIDDAQWGDGDSAAFLGELLRAEASRGLLVVTSSREEAGAESPVLGSLERASLSVRDVSKVLVPVEPLPEDATAQLVAVLLGRPDDAGAPDVRRIARESAGSPLVAGELTRLARGGPHEALVAGESILASRLAALPEASRRFVEIVAISGEPIPTGIVLRAAGRGEGDRSLLHQLRAAHWLRAVAVERQEGLDTFHDRMREEVLARLPADRARELHGRIAAALETAERPAVHRLARHLARAGQTERACRYAVRAAEEASAGLAFDRSVELYELAASLATPADRAALLPALARAYGLAGRTVDAANVHLEIAERTTGNERLDQRRLAADALLRSGRIDQALRLLGDIAGDLGVEIARPGLGPLAAVAWRRVRIALRGLRYKARTPEEISPRTRVRLDMLATLAATIGVADPLRGLLVQASFLLEALDAGNEPHICRAFAFEASFAAVRGDAAKAALLARRVTQLSQRVGGTEERVWSEFSHAICAHAEYRFEAAAEHYANVEQLFRQAPSMTHWELTTARLYRSFMMQYYRGAYRTAVADVEAAIEDARRRNDLHASTVFSAVPLMWLRLADDRPEEARAALDGALEEWPKDSYFLMHLYVEHSIAVVLLYMGHTEEAAELALRRQERANAAGLHRVAIVRNDGVRLIALTALAAGRYDVARAWAKQLRRSKYDAVRGNWHIVEAAIAAHEGDRDRAHRELIEAADCFERASALAYLAAVRDRLGAFLGGAEGEALRAKARGWAEAEGIVAPGKIYAINCPFPGMP
jgi:tetratricopeptide (TPR) repeat protein